MRGIYKVPFHDDETATSLAVRLAAANLIAVYPFCEDQGFSFRGVIGGNRDALTRLSEISHVPTEKLFRNAYVSIKKSLGILRGEEVRSPWVTPYLPRVCAFCLHDDLRREQGPRAARRYTRIHWQIPSIRSCEIHHAPLVDLPRPGSYRAFDLDFQATSYANGLNDALGTRDTAPFTEYERFIINRLDGRREAGALLDGMSMFAAMDIIELLGVYTTFGKNANLTKLSRDDRNLGAQTGYALMKQGREGIRQFLQMVTADSNGKRGARGGREIIGGIDTCLGPIYPYRQGPEYDLIRAEISAFVNEHGAMTAKRKMFGQRSSAAHLGIADARKILSGSEPQARTLLRHFAGEADLSTTVFSLSVIEEAKRFLDDLAFPKEAQPLLGVNNQHFTQLVEHGIVVKDELYARLFPGSLPRFSKTGLEKLIDSARSAASLGSNEGLFKVGKAMQKIHGSYAETISLLVDRKLSRVFYDTSLTGLASIFVDPAEVSSHAVVGEEWMSTHQVAALLKLSRPNVWLMTGEGYFQVHRFRVPGRMNSIFFARSEIEEFHRTYVSSSELAGGTGMNSHWVAERLKTADVAKVRARTTVFYERVEAENAINAELGRQCP